MHRVKYDYKDIPTIKKFALSDARFRYLIGPIASGKTSGCVMEIIRRCNEQNFGKGGIRRSKWMVIADSLWQLKDCTIPSFMDWFPPEVFGNYRLSDRTYVIDKLTETYIEILFRTLDDFRDEYKFPDFHLTAAWFNGCGDIPQRVFDMMDSRIQRYPSVNDGGCKWAGIIIDTCPPDTRTFLRKLAMGKNKRCEVFRQPSGLSDQAENMSNLPPDYYRMVAAGKDEWWVDKYIHGEMREDKL